VGTIGLPATANCTGCGNSVVDFGVIGLVKDGPRIQVATGKTNSQGQFDTGDLNAIFSNPSNGSLDTNGDGKRTLIVVATVNSTTSASIGGVQSVTTGTLTTRNFSATTQVACLAAVYLTAGVTSPCLVKATCGPSDVDCVQTVDPDALDSTRIGRLEQAAAFISADVVFPADNPRSSCAVIKCTNAGTTSATSQCVTDAFQTP